MPKSGLKRLYAPQDEDPYVRKTAAMCVAKLHDINAELVEDRGFLDALKVRPCLSLHHPSALCLSAFLNPETSAVPAEFEKQVL